MLRYCLELLPIFHSGKVSVAKIQAAKSSVVAELFLYLKISKVVKYFDEIRAAQCGAYSTMCQYSLHVVAHISVNML